MLLRGGMAEDFILEHVTAVSRRRQRQQGIQHIFMGRYACSEGSQVDVSVSYIESWSTDIPYPEGKR